MKRRLTTKKLLVAAVGVGAVSYVIACSSEDISTSGNLMAYPNDASQDVAEDNFATSGNLMAPPDTGADVHADAPGDAPGDAPSDAADAGTDAADASADASDDGG